MRWHRHGVGTPRLEDRRTLSAGPGGQRTGGAAGRARPARAPPDPPGWWAAGSPRRTAARRHDVALNLLTFPGVTDREGEVSALAALIVRHQVDQLQTRPLAIDPLQYLEVAEGRGAGGVALGLREMLRRLRRAAPWLSIGNFSRAKTER